MPRGCRRQEVDERILCDLRIHPRRHSQVEPCSRLGLHGRRRSDHRRRVDAEDRQSRSRPDHFRDRTRTHQIDTVENRCVGAELLSRIVDAIPRLGVVQPGDRGVPIGVAQRGEHGDEHRQGIGRRTAEHPGMHGRTQGLDGDDDVGDAAQRGGETRFADREIA